MAEEELEDLDDLTGAGMTEGDLEPEQQTQGPDIVDQAQNLKDQFDQGKELYQKGKEKLATRAEKKAGEGGAKKGLKGVEKKGAEAAKRKVATRVEGEAAKQAAVKGAAKVGASAVGKIAAGSVLPVVGNIVMAILTGLQLLWPAIKKYGKIIIYAVAVLLLLLAVPFGLLGGKGSPQYPATAGQQSQINAVAYLGGDFLAGRQLTDTIVIAEKKRYQVVVARVNSSMPERAGEVEQKVAEITSLMEQAIGLSGELKKKMTKEVVSKVKLLDDTLPYGKWIAEAAQARVGQENKSFCTRTGAGESVACGSFVTETLQAAGVPIPLSASTKGVWDMVALKLVANRLSDAVPSYFDQIKDQLQPGDIIWWGDGNCSLVRYGGKIFDHVGFYIGNGISVDTSSTAGKVLKRGVHDRPSCWSVNGAKRYGAKI